MARIEDLFERYSEEFLANRIEGNVRIQGIQDIESRLPLDIELLSKDNDGLLFQTNLDGTHPTIRISPNSEIDLDSFDVFPLISGLFQLTSYNSSAETGVINYLPCGRGQSFTVNIAIGYDSSYIASRRQPDKIKLENELHRNYVFENSLGSYILEEVYPDSDTNKTLHAMKYAADLEIKDQKYILNKSRRKNIGSVDDFCRYRLIRYPSIDFVEESKAQAIFERIKDKVTKGTALLNIWDEYSEKELEKANQLSALFGEINYSESIDKADHIKVLKLDLSKDQKTAFKEHEMDFKNSSFEKSDNPGSRDSETYQIRGVNKRFNFIYVEVVDEQDTLPPSGRLVLSTKGDAHVRNRRQKALEYLEQGRGSNTIILRNLLFAIENEAADMTDFFNESYLKPLTPRTRVFLQKRFGISDLTENQRRAVEIALNTPDVAVIQGPPGTGKSTVIAVICDRLFEEAEKRKKNKDRYNRSKLILASAFQNDTVEHIASKIEDKDLPTVKIGKDSMTIAAEQIVVNRMIESIDSALQYYAPKSSASRLSIEVKKIKATYIKEHNLAELKENVTAILPSLGLDDRLWNEWRLLSKHFGKSDVMKDDKRIKALKGLSTDLISYNDSGYYEVQKLLHSGIELANEERQKLDEAPLDDPSEDFLQFLSAVKEKYLSELEMTSETALAGNNEHLLAWLDEVISFERQKEENAYNDIDTFITANLETLREEIEGESSYIRESIMEYSESIAATNQKAGSKDVNYLFQNVILEEAARSNPLDLLIPMTKALRRIILVGDQKQLPQLIENDIVEDVVENKYNDLAERDIARKKYESSLFGILYKNLEKAPRPKRYIRLNEQFRMHPAIGEFISSLYYDNEVKAGLEEQAKIKSHSLTTAGLKDKVMVFCDVKRELGEENGGIGRFRKCEAERVMTLVGQILTDPNSQDLSIGVITFYAAQRDLLFKEAASLGYASFVNGEYEIADRLKTKRDGNEKLRIGTVDSFQGKEFDVVILSTTRSNSIERNEANVRKVFGFLTSENRLNVAFSRAQRLLIVCGDGEMFNDEYAQTYVKGLYEFYVNQSTNKDYGTRIN